MPCIHRLVQPRLRACCMGVEQSMSMRGSCGARANVTNSKYVSWESTLRCKGFGLCIGSPCCSLVPYTACTRCSAIGSTLRSYVYLAMCLVLAVSHKLPASPAMTPSSLQRKRVPQRLYSAPCDGIQGLLNVVSGAYIKDTVRCARCCWASTSARASEVSLVCSEGL